MKIIINDSNIKNYVEEFEKITGIIWRMSPLNDSILNGFSNLKIIECKWINITSLDALKFCSELMVLNCSYNNISSLEPLSNCHKLVKLNCSNNNLSSLDGIEYCHGLENLNCGYNNIILKSQPSKKIFPLIKSSKFPKLEKLNCNHNNITSLKIFSQALKLRHVKCSNNQLSTLNGLEKCSNMEYLNCNNNLITTLDAIKYCHLLSKLKCSNNQLVLPNAFDALLNLYNLQYLNCGYNEMKSLNVIKNCTNLLSLKCNNNCINSINMVENCTELEKINCSNNLIPSLKSLKKCTKLKKINCSFNRLKSLKFLTYCTYLKELNCSYNNIKSFNSLIYVPFLTNIIYNSNPCFDSDNFSKQRNIQIERIFDRIKTNEACLAYYKSVDIKYSFSDRVICKIIQKILSDPVPVFSIEEIKKCKLKIKTKQTLISYCLDTTICKFHLITFQELFSYVWRRIINSPELEKIFALLNSQVIKWNKNKINCLIRSIGEFII